MNMDYRKLNDADLVDFSKNVKTSLTGGLVVGLDAHIAADLATALDPVNTSYESSIEMGVQRTAVKQTAIADKQILRDDVLVRLAKVRNYLVAAECPKTAFEACGFTYPKTGAKVIASDPTNLTATGASNGVNQIRFSGNNRPGSVVYEIWRRQGDEGGWGIIITTKRQLAKDTPVTPGQYYEYKVRAVAARSVSNFSNSAVVYGAP